MVVDTVNLIKECGELRLWMLCGRCWESRVTVTFPLAPNCRIITEDYIFSSGRIVCVVHFGFLDNHTRKPEKGIILYHII